MKAGSRRAILMAFGANLGIAIAKFVAFIATGSASMLAEAVHSVADTGNQALLLWGAAAAEREATPTHPFGYGRERYFWAFVVALLLFSLGCLFATSHGIETFNHDEPLTKPEWAIGVLLLGIGKLFLWQTFIIIEFKSLPKRVSILFLLKIMRIMLLVK